MDNPKMLCQECTWRGLSSERLVARSPFDARDIVFGCPACKEVNCFHIACDEDGCWDPGTCGTPTKTGYRTTCSCHKPRDKS